MRSEAEFSRRESETQTLRLCRGKTSMNSPTAVPSASRREDTQKWKQKTGEFSRSNIQSFTTKDVLSWLASEGCSPPTDDGHGSVKKLLCELAHTGYLTKIDSGRFSPNRFWIPQQAPVAPTVAHPTPAPQQVQPPPYPVVPPPAPMAFQPQPATQQAQPTLDDLVGFFMVEYVLKKKAFVVERLIQSLVQKQTQSHIHIKDIGYSMASWANRYRGVSRWSKSDGYIGENTGYAVDGLQPPAGWIQISG